MKRSGDCIQVRQRAAGDQDALLEEPMNGLTSSGLQCRCSNSKSTREIQGGTKLTNIRVKLEGNGSGWLSPGTEALAGAIGSFFFF